MLINLKFYAVCTAVVIALVSVSYVYLSYRIECEVKDRYERKLQEFRAEELQNLQDLQHEQNETVTVYLNEINILKQQHEQDLKEIENAKFKDTVTVPVPFPVIRHDTNCGLHENNNGAETVPTAGVKSDLICYTRAELQSKIKRSLDLAAECDNLAERYRALVKVCTQSE
jgi:Ca2+/Na+ antiporter